MEKYFYSTLSGEIPLPFTKLDILGIGRYTKIVNGITYTLDVVFDRLCSNKWNTIQKNEYLYGNNGYYKYWTYDLDSSILRKTVMEWVNELPYNKRDYHTVLRHIMYYMSSDNSNNDALMVGKWNGIYTEDGKRPSYWNSTKMIFEERARTNLPVRYGQCWCFAECMTSICRFLGIACRTVSGKNTLIDENLDNGIDFMDELRKSDTSETYCLIDKSNLLEIILATREGVATKAEPWENMKIYDVGDSFWTKHLWNEVYIPRDDSKGWEILDSTPLFKSQEDDEYGDYKLLGPCQVSTFKTNHKQKYDYKQLFSFINSPFRLWGIESIVENGEIIHIPYVYSIIYPSSKSNSIYIDTAKIRNLFNCSPKITTRTPGYTSTVEDDITNSYMSPSLKEMYFSDFPTEGNYYCQFVYLDRMGNIMKTIRRDFTLPLELPQENINYHILSILMIERINENEEDTNDEMRCIVKPKWFTFLKYNN